MTSIILITQDIGINKMHLSIYELIAKTERHVYIEGGMYDTVLEVQTRGA